MKFGVQLYGPLSRIQEAQEIEPVPVLECLRALAQAGITEIEPCVDLDGSMGQEEIFWPVDWLTENAAAIQGLGLETRSAHVFAENLAGAIEKLKALAKRFEMRQFVVKTPMDCSLQQTALTYMKVADALAEEGVLLLIHNQAEEIRTKIGGKTAYERLLDLCMGKVFAQVDVGWVQFAGEDPAAFLLRNEGRVKSLHHKDFPAGAESLEDVPLGAGDVDLAACFRFAQHRNIPQIIDQEHFTGEDPGDIPGQLAALFEMLTGFVYDRGNTASCLNTYDVETGEVRTLYRFNKVIEAPNWLKTRDVILFNAEGRMYRFYLDNEMVTMVNTGLCDNCNNDHVPSPDESRLAVSHMAMEDGQYTSKVYTLPLDAQDLSWDAEDRVGGAVTVGGRCEPKLITPHSPSYLHGWSPDGKELAYCAFRDIDGRQEVDVYTIPAQGGEERRLTGGGFNDGPEYSPDGRHIWYNSTRSGLMQIWRMDRDGGNPMQITKNDRNNWFGHISPDGKKVVYLSYGKDQLEPQEHLPNMPVELWLMDADGGNPHKILSLFGGQGTMNVNSWAGDSRRFAFVSYEAVE